MRPEEMVGQILGRYRIVRPIGYGGMATVFLAQDMQLRREVAIKVFSPRPGESADFLRRFAREAQVLAQLDHPNILPIYDYGEQGSIAYLVMPYIAGGSLKDLLRARRAFLPAEALRLIAQVLNALQYAHERGLIHRDIKPGNMLLKADGTLLLSDFGLVKVSSVDGSSMIAATQTGQMIAGTPEYMAPEQAFGQALPASDIYSVGVVLYEMLTGTRPFTADTALGIAMKHAYEQPPSLRQFNPQISPQLDTAVLQALVKDPTQRFQRPAAFLQALIQATTSEGLPGSSSLKGWSAPTTPATWPPLPPQQEVSRVDLPAPGSMNINDPEANRATFIKNPPRGSATPYSVGGYDPEANIETFVKNPQSAYPTPHTPITPKPPQTQSNAGTFTTGTPPSLTPPQRTRLSFIAVAILLLTIFSLLAGLFILPQGRRLLGLTTGQTQAGTPGSNQANSQTPINTAGPHPVRGGTWTDDLFGSPDSLIPNASVSTFSGIVDQAIWSPLFYGDAQGNIQPDLATEIPTTANGGVSADVKTWTFHLRPGLKWSDGQPLDSRDVDYSWKLWTGGKFPSASTIGFNLIASADISPDNLTITFHLKQSFAPFLSVWVDGLNAPLPAHHYSSMAPDKIQTSSDNLNPPVTSGPFIMRESVSGDHYTVIRNPNYYWASEGYPYLDKVIFHIVPDQNTILKDLQAGNIDSAWFLDVTKVQAYKQLTNYKLSSNPNAANFEAMYFNFHNSILGTDIKVRQAMAMAVDHNTLIEVARRGYAAPLCIDHGQAYHPGYQSNAPCPKFDVAGANALLDADGWVKGSDGFRHKGGQVLAFKYSTTANNTWRSDDEQILQQNMKAIGINLEIQNYPASTFFGTFLPDGKPGMYDIAEFENSFIYDADDSSLLACNQIPPNGFNITSYCNHQLDNLYVQEQSTADPAARQQIFNQIHQIYLTDFPFINLYGPTDIAMNKNITHNYTPGPFGASETINIWQWWCNGGQC